MASDRDAGTMLAGRVAVVTGAGRGIGRAEATRLAAYGARVVVNDLGVATDGSETAETPADEVVAEIVAAGGEAVADRHDVASTDGGEAVVAQALDTWGRVDIVVNNAGFGRPRMVFNLSSAEWDDVIRVHLRGAFAVSAPACRWWRGEHKAGRGGYGRLLNTATGLLVYGGAGQSNYVAAKAGVMAFTEAVATEMAPYGVTANTIMPSARTRLAAIGWRVDRNAARRADWSRSCRLTVGPAHRAKIGAQCASVAWMPARLLACVSTPVSHARNAPSEPADEAGTPLLSRHEANPARSARTGPEDWISLTMPIHRSWRLLPARSTPTNGWTPAARHRASSAAYAFRRDAGGPGGALNPLPTSKDLVRAIFAKSGNWLLLTYIAANAAADRPKPAVTRKPYRAMHVSTEASRRALMVPSNRPPSAHSAAVAGTNASSAATSSGAGRPAGVPGAERPMALGAGAAPQPLSRAAIMATARPPGQALRFGVFMAARPGTARRCPGPGHRRAAG